MSTSETKAFTYRLQTKSSKTCHWRLKLAPSVSLRLLWKKQESHLLQK